MEQEVEAITASISSQLPLEEDISKSEYITKVDAFQEIMFNISALLQRNSHATAIWIELLALVSEHLLAYKQFYRSLVLVKKQEWNTLPVENRIAITYSMYGRLVAVYLAQNETPHTAQFQRLVCNTLSLSEVSYIGEIQYFNNTETLVSQCASKVAGLESHITPANYVRMLTYILRAAYVSGHSSHALELIRKASPLEAVALIRDSSIEYAMVTDFLKYAAFNLVAVSVMDTHIDDSYNLRADLFFRVLLNLPNFKLLVFQKYNFGGQPSELSAWTDPAPAMDPSFIADDPLVRRQEISLMYVLNYLLSLTDIAQLVDPDGYYEPELTFLSQSLRWRNSKDIMTASRSGSTHSEALLYMEHNEDPAAAPIAVGNHPSLSSMILHGTYSQINTMVCQFLRCLRKPRLNIPDVLKSYILSGDSELQHNASLIDPEKFPGKIAYAHAVDKIVRLVHVLSVRFLVDKAGFDTIPPGIADLVSQIIADPSVKPSLFARRNANESLQSRKADIVESAHSIRILNEISARLDMN